MDYRQEDQQQRQQLLNIVDRGTLEELFNFLQKFHRKPFQHLADVMVYNGVIDDQIDFIDCTGTKYNVTPLIIAAGKGSYEKTKILLVHGANPNKQCATGDTALNLAVHRQKYPIADLLLEYHGNPNISNQAGKTALHRAVVSNKDGNANHIRTLLNAGADPTIEDRNQRIPLDEAVINNRPDIVDVLLSHDQTLIKRAYRAAIIASRLGYDECLKILLSYGMDPNIIDRTNTTPLHVAVRSLKLSTVRLLVANGADPNIANNRGETATDIAEFVQADQQQNFINALLHTPKIALSDFHSHKPGNAISYVYPLLRNHPNWTLDSDEFRSRTAENSSIQNLLDTSSGTYWCCTQSKNAWIIFDLKHEYNITGVRIIGCDNQSTPKNGHLDVSNALNGPWLKIKDFTCLLTKGNTNDFFFSSSKTRFIRVFILDNYGGEDIRIQGIGFFGLDMRLVDLLKQFRLENSLNTLLANGINDQETLYENQDEILNSSDKYLHINDHFQFIRLTESLKSPQLSFLEWFNPPQTTVIAGEKLQTFSVAADQGVTDRIKLEEKLENSPQATTVLMRDLEPIQGRSLVDFPDYIIKYPGRYQIRVVSVQSPDIHTPWQEIVVGLTLPYASRLNTVADENLYLSSTTHFFDDTTSDKDNATLSEKTSTTNFANKDNRAFIITEYESDNDDIGSDTYLISLKSIEDSPYCFSLTKMSHTTGNVFVNYQPGQSYKPEHFTQTKMTDYFDHSTNTDEGYEDDSNSLSHSDSKLREEIYLTPTKFRSVSRLPLSNIFPNANINNRKQSDDDDDIVAYGDKIIIPTKYRLQQDRIKKLLNDENTTSPQQQSQIQIEQQSQFQQRQPSNQNGLNQELPQRQQSQYHQRQQSRQQNESPNESPSQQHQAQYQQRQQSKQQNESPNESPSQQHQAQYHQRQQSRKQTELEEEPLQQQSQYHQQEQLENQNAWVQNSLPSSTPQQQSQYHQRQHSRQRNGSERELSPSPPQQKLNYYEIDESQRPSELVQESLLRQQQSEYHQQEQLQNQNAWVRDSSPSSLPQQQQPQYYQLQQARQQNGSRRESTPEQPQKDNYQLEQSQKRSESTRESPSQLQQSQYDQQQQSRQRSDSKSGASPTQLKEQQQQQQSRKRNESEQDSSYVPPYYDEISEPRIEPDEKPQVNQQQYYHRQQEQQQLIIENIDQDHLKPLYNRYQIISGDLELRENPSDNSLNNNESKPGQMQLIFKATLQGSDVQERAKNSLNELVSNRSRTQSTSNINKQNNLTKTSYPNSPQSSINADRQNQNLTNIVANHEREYQTGSNHNSRLNSISHFVQSPTAITKSDHGNLSPTSDYPPFQPSSPPDQSIKRSIYNDHSSAIGSNHQSNNQSSLLNQLVPSNTITHSANDNDLEGIRERSPSSSETYTSPKYVKNPLKQTKTSHTPPLLSSPPKSSQISFEHKSKYFFGENVQNQLSDEDSDETECETFGHNSQPRPLLNTNTRRNLDYPFTTNSRFATNDNNYSENLQFGQQTDVATSIGNSLTQQQRDFASANQSTVEKPRDSPHDSQTSISNKQIPPQDDYEVPDVYPVMNNYNGVNQNMPNSMSSTTSFQQKYRVDSNQQVLSFGGSKKREQPLNKLNQDGDYDNQSQYEEDDHDHNNDHINEDQDDDQDMQDQNHDDHQYHNYQDDMDDEDDNLPRDDESDHAFVPRQPGVNELLNKNPVSNIPTNLLPPQYPPMNTSALSDPNNSSTKKKSKKGGFFGFLRKDKNKDVGKSNTKPSKQKSNQRKAKASSNEKRSKR